MEKHGMKNTRVYRIWRIMKQRCNNPNHKSYRFYGAKGVKVCEEWEKSFVSFKDWAFSNGYTDELTIDRIESDKGYAPGNCRWITLAENSRRASLGKPKPKKEGYKRGRAKSTKLYEFKGKIQTLWEWENELGIPRTTLNMRINKYDWPIEKAFTEPVRKKTSH